MDKLLPCPWCQKAPSESLIDGDRIFACATENCPAEGYPYHESDWNRRPAPQAHEETRGAPAPAQCPSCWWPTYERPQAPAPASPAAPPIKLRIIPGESTPQDTANLLEALAQLYRAHGGTGIEFTITPAEPEAGAPGTQTPKRDPYEDYDYWIPPAKPKTQEGGSQP